ncbi:uncharacterized protein LOC110931436 [Helianthus annuus]|uniref:uncharacterized protein LOC110931436 n=1 Tax=Helianthus annuus TaxID=4232 RepID=UPI00165337B6|nr:uncharacterized protein LOC110931436 [Helianthus annuus]
MKMEEEVMTDVKSDTQTENVETVQGDEEITEGQDVVDVEKLVGVTEVDDAGEPVEADEDKLVDTDVESDEEKAGAESPEQSVKPGGAGGRNGKEEGRRHRILRNLVVEGGRRLRRRMFASCVMMVETL